jgi:hypothetical protein
VLSAARWVATRLLPKSFRQWRWQRIKARREAAISSLSLQQKFDRIYGAGWWGRQDDGSMSSGQGTRDYALVEPYVGALREFFRTLAEKPTLLDVGAGDFAVGSLIAPMVKHYRACDISSAIIAQNERRFSHLSNVEFGTLDATVEPLPEADIVSIRQVLQHLSNEQIAAIVPKLSAFKYAIITEEVPEGPFVPNVDHHSGFTTRLTESRSGVDLAKAPFHMPHRRATIVCELKNAVPVAGLVRTTIYEMT